MIHLFTIGYPYHQDFIFRSNVAENLSHLSYLSPVQTDATLLAVACCVRLHTLLHVVRQSLKPVKLLSQQLPTFHLFHVRRRVAQQCWIRLYSSFQHFRGDARALHLVSKVLWVISFPRGTAGPNVVGRCCIRLHTTANTDAINPNIVGPIMSGVVASVCT